MWTMMPALCRVCDDLQLPSPLPAGRVERVGCLRTLGASMVWGGLSRRPHFAAGLETHHVIEACLSRAICTAGISDSNWGGDVYPKYQDPMLGRSNACTTAPRAAGIGTSIRSRPEPPHEGDLQRLREAEVRSVCWHAPELQPHCRLPSSPPAR